MRKQNRGVAQLGQSAWFGTRRSQVRILSPRLLCGCSSMVEHQPSKLDTWVRFPSPAFTLPSQCNMCSQLSWIEQRPSKPWVGGSNPFEHIRDKSRWPMVGIAQLVSAPDCGSGGPGFESLYPPFFYLIAFAQRLRLNLGLSPSGKAQDFDSCISLVRIQLALFLQK